MPLPAQRLMPTPDASLRVAVLAQCDGQRLLLHDARLDWQPLRLRIGRIVRCAMDR